VLRVLENDPQIHKNLGKEKILVEIH